MDSLNGAWKELEDFVQSHLPDGCRLSIEFGGSHPVVTTVRFPEKQQVYFQDDLPMPDQLVYAVNYCRKGSGLPAVSLHGRPATYAPPGMLP